ncbi:hypothetical protein EUX98_g1686 [Antrodiella citrinella]|uniref:SnoaL-like domain-containing protein n=1 Tax=Antrodiella citrinella TaxID=2447956 RepID=A0A4S4N0W1_9APHY|nr:hypothetical protein EUX98_g1686 [Antrodiella citrinella]
MPLIPTDASKNPSPRLKVVLRWLEALTDTHDVNALASLLTDDYTHSNVPRSIGFPPYFDRASFLAHAEKTLIYVLHEYKYSVLEVVETEDRVVVHAYADIVTSTGHAFESEIMILAHVVSQPDGEYKIRYWKEFLDTKMMADDYYPELKRMEEVAKQSA